MSYIKKYGIGNVRLEAPYSHFIYELPLLSFGDVMHTVGVSLVFNSRLIGQNPFYMSNGHKLSLQKRLIIQGGSPGVYENGDGSRVNLIKLADNRYTFDDDSQRIIRGTGQAYILENPDYSTETYTTLGRITSVADKYGNTLLTYAYDESQSDKLMSVTYRDNKVINLTYNNLGVVGGIEYLCNGSLICRSTLAYPGTTNTIVGHYSGVSYYTSYSGNTFTAYSANGSSYTDYSHKVTCTKAADSLTITKLIGQKTVDTITYDFVNINDGIFDIVDITDFQGVKTRVQYANGKPAYSYEVNQSIFPENNEGISEFKFKENVSIYSNEEIVGVQMINDGIPMNYNSNLRRWACDLEDPGAALTDYVVISGWVKKIADQTISGTTPECTLILSDYNMPSALSFPLGNLPLGIWVYFTIRTANAYDKALGFAAPMVETNLNSFQGLTADIRITPQHANESPSDNDSHITNIDNIFITNDGSEIAIDGNLQFYFGYRADGESDESDKIDRSLYPITVDDIIKYQLKEAKNLYIGEIYACNSKVVFVSRQKLTVGVGGNRISVSSLKVGRRYYKGDKCYLSETEFNSGGNLMTVRNYIDGVEYSVQNYDSDLNLISSVVDGIETEYEYKYLSNNKCSGLVKSKNVANYIINSVQYDDAVTKTISTTDEFGNITSYITDPVWGTVTKATAADGTSVTDTFDSDFSTQLSRIFKKGNDSKLHKFTYLYTGNLYNIESGALNYTFGYDMDMLTSVQKVNDFMGQTDISDDMREATTYYPGFTGYDYTLTENYDKYGRLTETTGLVRNAYDVDPTCTDGTYDVSGVNNGSSRLASSTDLTTGEVTRYAYVKDRVSKIGTFSSTSTVLDESEYTYDKLGRLTSEKFSYDPLYSGYVKRDISYVKDENDPTADGRPNFNYCYLGLEPKAVISYTYDEYKRPYTRAMRSSFDATDFFVNVYEYDKTRVSRVRNLYDETNLGTDSFSYDSQGRIVSHSYDSDYNSYDKTYVYDSFGQLVRENNEGLDKTFIYCYDNIGNITKVESYPYTTGEVSGTPTVTNYSYSVDKLTSFSGNSITYDNMGQPTYYNGRSYAWNNGKLASITKGSTTQAGSLYENCSFTYDGYGRRRSKTYIYDNNPASSSDYSYRYDTVYTYDNSGRLIRETLTETTTYSGGGSTTREFLYLYDDSGIIGVMYGPNLDNLQTYYYRSNLQGDVTAIYDANGNRKVEYAYDAFGNCSIVYGISHDLARRNPVRYRGYYLDRETGLYYLNARYYNPQWRRFISPDSPDYLDSETPNGLNLYAYCNNDPVNYADPSGHFMISTAVLIGAIIGAVVGAGVGFGIAVYNDYKDDGEIFNGSVAWYDYLGATLLGGAIGAVVGGAIGYGVGYFAGGTYSNGLVAKSVTKGVKSFMSNSNNINHVLGNPKHNLFGYTEKSMMKLMKKTLSKGTYEAYKTVDSMVLASTNSQVTYKIIKGAIMISNMWIKMG